MYFYVGTLANVGGQNSYEDDTKMKKAIMKFLKVTRSKHLITQREMSKRLGVNRSNYARYEATGVISAENLLNFMSALNIKPSELDEIFLERKGALDRAKFLEELDRPLPKNEMSQDEVRALFLKGIAKSFS